MRIIRAEHLGWCFGVRDAVQLVTEQARHGAVTVLGDLVHNESVNAALRAQGVQLVRNLDRVETDTVVITAHGVSDSALEQVRQAVPRVLEATCPLVHFAHRALRELVATGYHPVVIGQRDHVEVRGLTGDLRAFDVVLEPDEVWRLPPRDRFGVVAQTTQPIERVRWLVALLQQAFPRAEIRFTDTVCLPTKQRQAAAIELARHCDVVVVVGGRHSNNTTELARTCAQHCRRVVRIETAGDLKTEWFTAADAVGITAGTSTPDATIAAVEQWLKEHYELHEMDSAL